MSFLAVAMVTQPDKFAYTHKHKHAHLKQQLSHILGGDIKAEQCGCCFSDLPF